MALHVPAAPNSLVKSWVQDAYDTLVGQRHWSFLRRDALITTRAARSVEVTLVQGSTAITSAAGFVSTDVGRNFRVATNSPVYTIDTVTDPSNAVLTQAYASDSTTATVSIQDIYLVMPSDFRSFNTVVDQTIQRPIAWWISKDRLDLYDPARISSDSRFRVLVAASLSTVTSLSGRVTYEAWPWPTAAGVYPMQYFKRTDQLEDDDRFEGPLATYTRALETGARAEAAKWPGTPTQKNPYFNLPLAKMLGEEFDQAVQNLDILDDDLYLTSLAQTDLAKFGLAALSADTNLLRMTDADLHSYF